MTDQPTAPPETDNSPREQDVILTDGDVDALLADGDDQ